MLVLCLTSSCLFLLHQPPTFQLRSQHIFGFSVSCGAVLFWLYRLDDPAVMLFIHHQRSNTPICYLFRLFYGLMHFLHDVRDKDTLNRRYYWFLRIHGLPGWVLRPRAVENPAPGVSPSPPPAAFVPPPTASSAEDLSSPPGSPNP